MMFANSFVLLPAWLLASALIVGIVSAFGPKHTTLASIAPKRVENSGRVDPLER